jgi:prephenate dehydrogenase
MWKDIALANQDAILKELDAYLVILEHMKLAIKNQDVVTLESMFRIASNSRNDWQG